MGPKEVPVSPSGFIQQCGRAIRMYGHRGLPAEEQTVTTQLFVTMLPKWMRSSSLACWALRAQKKHTSGKEVEKRARVLTARMNRAGIASLEELKTKLDSHGLEKQKSLGRSGREGLTADDVLTFLEQNGLWEEARLLRTADKKEKELKEKEKEAGESLRRKETDSQILRGATLETIPEPEGAVEEDFANALESMIDEELAANPREDGEEEERAQEMEALKEEQAAQEEELDGDEAQRKPMAKDSDAPAKPTTVSMTPAEVAACLVDVLSTLRSACRDADRKPLANDAKVVRRASSKAFGAEAEAVPIATVPEPVAAADATVAEGAPAAADPVPSNGAAAEVSEALVPAEPVTEASAVDVTMEGTGPGAMEKTGEAAPAFGEEPWRKPLVAGLEKARRCEAFVTAFRSAFPSLDPLVCDLKMLTVHQVRTLRDEIAKFEKVETLRMAVAMIREVKATVAEAEALAAPAAPAEAETPVPGDAAPEPMEVETKPDADEPMPAASSAPRDEAQAAADAEAEAPPAAPAAAPVAPGPDPAEMEEKRKAVELAWRRQLAAAFRELRRSEHVKHALEVACPGMVEKAVAADAQAEKEEMPEEQEQDADLLSLGIGPEHVKRLYDELQRLLEQAEKGAAKPRALVRAMQMLYLAESISDAVASLKPETADEEALSQLTERTQEFAPALDAMRSLAVDRDVFAHLADELVEEHCEAHESESEASDLNKELVGKKNEPAPVVLPPGWRMEWVKRKKKEMREFVDPQGNRYRNVKEVRAALLEVEAREAALKAVAKAAEVNALMASKRHSSPAFCVLLAYQVRKWGLGSLTYIHGSVFPKAFIVALPSALLAMAIHVFANDLGFQIAESDDVTAGVIGGYTFVLGFLINTRASEAYSRWWEGGTLMQQLRGEWFNAYSSLLAFCSTDPEKREVTGVGLKLTDVQKFQQLLVRLMSLLYCSALQQVATPPEVMPESFEIIETVGMDAKSLKFLDNVNDKVEVVLQWIQRLIVENHKNGIWACVVPVASQLHWVAPPILSRVFQEYSRGIVNLNNARKIAEFPFPFPLVQCITFMLGIHWFLIPIICASSIKSLWWAGTLTFVVVFSFWSTNHLPLEDMQVDMNESLLTLMHKHAQFPPDFECINCFAIPGTTTGNFKNDGTMDVSGSQPQDKKASASPTQQKEDGFHEVVSSSPSVEDSKPSKARRRPAASTDRTLPEGTGGCLEMLGAKELLGWGYETYPRQGGRVDRNRSRSSSPSEDGPKGEVNNEDLPRKKGTRAEESGQEGPLQDKSRNAFDDRPPGTSRKDQDGKDQGARI
eukprot:s197_g3.t3